MAKEREDSILCGFFRLIFKRVTATPKPYVIHVTHSAKYQSSHLRNQHVQWLWAQVVRQKGDMEVPVILDELTKIMRPTSELVTSEVRNVFESVVPYVTASEIRHMGSV